jgi:hypothetical protein
VKGEAGGVRGNGLTCTEMIRHIHFSSYVNFIIYRNLDFTIRKVKKQSESRRITIRVMLSNAKHPAMRDDCKTALRHDLYDLGTDPSPAAQDDTLITGHLKNTR